GREAGEHIDREACDERDRRSVDEAEQRRLVKRTCAIAALAIATACGRSPASAPDDPEVPALARLREVEVQAREAAVFDAMPASDRAIGPDPYVIAALPSSAGDRARFAAILRGRGALVLLDASLREIARATVGRSPSGLAVDDRGELLVVSEL